MILVHFRVLGPIYQCPADGWLMIALHRHPQRRFYFVKSLLPELRSGELETTTDFQLLVMRNVIVVNVNS